MLSKWYQKYLYAVLFAAVVILWKIELFAVPYCCNHNLFLSELKLEYIVYRHNDEWSFDHACTV